MHKSDWILSYHALPKNHSIMRRLTKIALSNMCHVMSRSRKCTQIMLANTLYIIFRPPKRSLWFDETPQKTYKPKFAKVPKKYNMIRRQIWKSSKIKLMKPFSYTVFSLVKSLVTFRLYFCIKVYTALISDITKTFLEKKNVLFIIYPKHKLSLKRCDFF